MNKVKKQQRDPFYFSETSSDENTRIYYYGTDIQIFALSLKIKENFNV